MPTIKSTNLALTNSVDRSTFSAKFHGMLTLIKKASATQYDTFFSKKRIIIESPFFAVEISGKFKSKSSGEQFKDITGKIKSFNISRKELTKDNSFEVAHYGRVLSPIYLFGVKLLDSNKTASLSISDFTKKAKFENLIANDFITNSKKVLDSRNKGRSDLVCAIRDSKYSKDVFLDFTENDNGWDSITGNGGLTLTGMLDGQSHFFPDKDTRTIVAFGKKNKYTLTMDSDDGRDGFEQFMTVKGFSSKDKIFIPRYAKDKFEITDDGKGIKSTSHRYYPYNLPDLNLDDCGDDFIIRPNQIKYY